MQELSAELLKPEIGRLFRKSTESNELRQKSGASTCFAAALASDPAQAITAYSTLIRMIFSQSMSLWDHLKNCSIKDRVLYMCHLYLKAISDITWSLSETIFSIMKPTIDEEAFHES